MSKIIVFLVLILIAGFVGVKIPQIFLPKMVGVEGIKIIRYLWFSVLAFVTSISVIVLFLREMLWGNSNISSYYWWWDWEKRAKHKFKNESRNQYLSVVVTVVMLVIISSTWNSATESQFEKVVAENEVWGLSASDFIVQSENLGYSVKTSALNGEILLLENDGYLPPLILRKHPSNSIVGIFTEEINRIDELVSPNSFLTEKKVCEDIHSANVEQFRKGYGVPSIQKVVSGYDGLKLEASWLNQDGKALVYVYTSNPDSSLIKVQTAVWNPKLLSK